VRFFQVGESRCRPCRPGQRVLSAKPVARDPRSLRVYRALAVKLEPGHPPGSKSRRSAGSSRRPGTPGSGKPTVPRGRQAILLEPAEPGRPCPHVPEAATNVSPLPWIAPGSATSTCLT